MERDPWIPLKASWWVDRTRQPLNLVVSSPSGGLIEIDLQRESGELMGITVVTMPIQADSPKHSFRGEVIDNALPVFDVSGWDTSDPARRFARETADLSWHHSEDQEVIFFDDVESVTKIACGPVAVGVGSQGELAGLWIESAAIDETPLL
ncbi:MULTISPECIES: hypothetical protein [unclassified Streptomyces]|uniref:hypothetical protein n=1 Tax=unclassified Streptomyces TaxID=2593676 RepID=UPI00278BB957|nr:MULTISPECIES: hypothetical protein [unclassified Streptomyces]